MQEFFDTSTVVMTNHSHYLLENIDKIYALYINIYDMYIHIYLYMLRL